MDDSHGKPIMLAIKVGYKPGDPSVPEPLTIVSKWQREYVPMPCSSQNETTWGTIKAALGGPLRTVDDIANAIKSYHPNVGDLSVLKHTVHNVRHDLLQTIKEGEKAYAVISIECL